MSIKETLLPFTVLNLVRGPMCASYIIYIFGTELFMAFHFRPASALAETTRFTSVSHITGRLFINPSYEKIRTLH